MRYCKELTDEIAKWVRENGLMDYGGAKLVELLKHFKINNDTYYEWMRKDEFSGAIKKAKEIFKSGLERDVVKSLANSAKGYEYTQVTREYKDGKEVKRTEKNIKVEPNVGAGIFILTNLAPEKWKNRQQVGNVGGNDDVIRVEVSGDDAKAVKEAIAKIDGISCVSDEGNK